MISIEVYSDFKFRMKTITMYLFGSWAWFIFSVILLVMLVCYPFTRSIQSTRQLVKNCAEWIIRLTRLELIVEGEENLTKGSSILVATKIDDPFVRFSSPSTMSSKRVRRMIHSAQFLTSCLVD